MSNPKIAMFTTFFPPYNFGGDGIGVSRLAGALAARGFDVTVAHDADAYLTLAKAEPAPSPAPPGVSVIPLKSRHGALSNLATHQLGRPVVHAAEITRLADAADVIWHHNVSLVGGPGILSLGQALKVYEAHEHWLVCPTHVLWRYNRERCDARKCLSCVLSYRRPPQLWRGTGFLDRQARKVDLFIAKSAFSRDKHREMGFAPEMEVVPYFLPPDSAPAPDAAAAPRAHDKPFFLFVGRLEKIKGVQDALPAFAGEEGPDFVVIGDGAYAAELRAMAAGLPRVKFLGRLPPEALTPFYRDALALITPSICFETFGIVIIEAFRKGLPVIARRLGPFPEILEAAQAGYLFNDAEDLRAAIAALGADPALRARLGAAASAAFAERWSEAPVMKLYLDRLEAAARRTGRDRLADAILERNAA